MLVKVLHCCMPLLGLFLAGCGAVGSPLPPLLDIPQPATALSAVQRGERILIAWPAPLITTEGVTPRAARLGPARILRAVFPALGAAPTADSFRATARVAGLAEGKNEYTETIDSAWEGRTVAYAVELLNRRGDSAGLSNLVMVNVLRTPPAPRVAATVMETAVVLTWTVSSGAIYSVYRDSENLGETSSGEFRDSTFQWERAYRYTVRAGTRRDGFLAESEDSPAIPVTPLDKFPPAAPAGLDLVVVEGGLELSWTPNREDDLAGYHVYRDGARLTTQPLAATAFRDTAPGRRYEITAVDRKGNESPRTALTRP